MDEKQGAVAFEEKVKEGKRKKEEKTKGYDGIVIHHVASVSCFPSKYLAACPHSVVPIHFNIFLLLLLLVFANIRVYES